MTFMLGTGARIGESLAVLWSQVDLDTTTVDITHTIARIKGDGLIRQLAHRTQASAKSASPTGGTSPHRKLRSCRTGSSSSGASRSGRAMTTALARSEQR
jgi:integrase